MKHKCGSTLSVKAKVPLVLFNLYMVTNNKNLQVTPTQIIGDSVVFEFDKQTFYCRSCGIDVPSDSDDIIVATCPGCKGSVSPKEAEVITFGEDSVVVCHQKCLDKVVKEQMKDRGIEEFNHTKLNIILKEI